MTKRFLFFLFTLYLSSSYGQSRDSISRLSQINGVTRIISKSNQPLNRSVVKILSIHISRHKVKHLKTMISFGINLNQASFSDNWSTGGINSIALGTKFSFKTDYVKNDKNYVTELLLQYGKQKNKGQFERKTSDRIFWDHKVGIKLSKSWNFFGSINFESQFDRGFSYGKDGLGHETRSLISRFMAPGYLTESLGCEYKPNKYFWLRIGTGTARQTFVSDTSLYHTNPKNYGVKHGNTFRNELAFQFVSNFDKNIAENLNLKTRYAMFANYENLENIDHRIDVTLAARINRLVNVSIAGIAAYDDDASTKIQGSQTFSFGLSYNFPK